MVDSFVFIGEVKKKEKETALKLEFVSICQGLVMGQGDTTTYIRRGACGLQ